MNGLAREDPEALAGSESAAPQQALVALWTAVGNLQARGKHGVPSEVPDLQTNVFGFRTACSKAIAQGIEESA
jgi:hypothetical protein